MTFGACESAEGDASVAVFDFSIRFSNGSH